MVSRIYLNNRYLERNRKFYYIRDCIQIAYNIITWVIESTKLKPILFPEQKRKLF